jgi:polyisoprenoid-binding protein YceI
MGQENGDAMFKSYKKPFQPQCTPGILSRSTLAPFFLLAGVLLFGYAPAQAAPLRLETEPQPQVEFVAVGRPSALKIKGTGVELNPSLSLEKGILQGKVEFSLASLETGLGLRDKHMKEKYLEVEKFPKSTFELSETPLPQELVTGKTPEMEIPFKGKLTLHGVTRDITVTARLTKKENRYQVATLFEVKLPEYAIDIPKFAGITVAEDVKLEVKFTVSESL